MENMCSNCGFYKTPPLFWGGSTEPSLCDCPKERSYSEEEVLEILVKAMKDVKVKQLTFFDGGSEYPIYSNLSKWFEQFKKK